jgi:ribosomal protein L29
MSELKDKSKKELEKMLKDTRESLRKFRFSLAGSGQKNVREGRNLRKQIARILTQLNSREA